MILMLLVSFSAMALDYDEPSFEEFFKIEENRANYKAALESGKLQQAKDQMATICKRWSTEQANLEETCKCAKEELSTLNNELLFYSSITAYQRYRAKVDALENDDKQRFEALKTHFAANPLVQDSFGKKLEDKCRPPSSASVPAPRADK